METIKTAFVVVLLLAVLFGVYSVLNKPDAAPPKEVAWMDKSGPDALKLDIGTGDDAKKNLAVDARGTVEFPSNIGEPSGLSADKLSRKPGNSAPNSSPSLSDPSNSPSLNDSDRGTAPPNSPRGFSSSPATIPDLNSDTNSNNAGTTQPNGNDRAGSTLRVWPPTGDLRSRSPQDAGSGGYNAGATQMPEGTTGGSRDLPPPSNLRSSYSEPINRDRPPRRQPPRHRRLGTAATTRHKFNPTPITVTKTREVTQPLPLPMVVVATPSPRPSTDDPSRSTANQ